MSSDPVSAPLRALLELFAAELSQVKFPDLDAEVLRNAAEAVSTRADALDRAQAALERARVELGESQEALLAKGQKALAYARIFAEENPELLSRLDAISLPRAARKQVVRALEPLPPAGPAEAPVEGAPPAPPKRRGRPPKSASTASLFNEAAPLEQVEESAEAVG